MIKVYEAYEQEYKALRVAAAALEMQSPNNTVYRVEDTYFDFGRGLIWTTIIAHPVTGNDWQVLNPHEHDLITSCDLDCIYEAVHSVVTDKYNPDRKK